MRELKMPEALPVGVKCWEEARWKEEQNKRRRKMRCGKWSKS